MTSAEEPGRRVGKRRFRESATKCAGEPISLDTHDSYGLGGGSARGYVTIGGGCAGCVGVTLPTSHKLRTVLS